MITIIATSLGNTKTSIDVEESCTCAELRDTIRATFKVPETSDIKLIFGGKIIKLDQTIEECGIKNKAVVVYMVSRKKPERPPVQTPEETTAPTPVATTPPVTNPVQTPSVPVNTDASAGTGPHVPSLDSFIEEESLFGLRSAVVSMAMEQLVGDKQLMLSILNNSPAFQRMLRSPNGLMIAMIINYPQFLTPEVFRSMTGMGEVDSPHESQIEQTPTSVTIPIPDSNVSVPISSTPNTVIPPSAAVSQPSQPTAESIEEKNDIDEICQIFPTKPRPIVARMYGECGKNKENTINLLLAI